MFDVDGQDSKKHLGRRRKRVGELGHRCRPGLEKGSRKRTCRRGSTVVPAVRMLFSKLDGKKPSLQWGNLRNWMPVGKANWTVNQLRFVGSVNWVPECPRIKSFQNSCTKAQGRSWGRNWAKKGSLPYKGGGLLGVGQDPGSGLPGTSARSLGRGLDKCWTIGASSHNEPE